jgi:hypothetical protein
MRTEYPGGGKGEKSLDAKSVQCSESILLGEDTNARYVHIRLLALYFSLHDSQYGADLLCRGAHEEGAKVEKFSINGGRF